MRSRHLFRLLLLAAVLLGLIATGVGAQTTTGRVIFMPLVPKDPSPTPTVTPTPDPTCPTTGQSYDLIPTTERYSGHAPHVSPDLNLSIRGWVTVNEQRSLVDYSGGTDPGAPQLYGIFTDDRTPAFTSTHRVYDWDWNNNQKGAPLSNWPVTLVGMATTPGEQLRLPRRNGSDIYQGTYWGLVVYAEKTRITLHYARNDYVAYAGGSYGMHIENVCVDPNLLAAYQQGNAAGRFNLPGLRNNQVLGTAITSEILVAIRDTGTFMDPRARKDWWMGRAAAEVVSDGSIEHTTGGHRTPTPVPTSP